jgi:hypothetical protein
MSKINPQSQCAKYARATFFTMAAMTLVLSLFVYLAYDAYHSPTWDPIGDSGAVQGFFIIFIAIAITIAFTAAAFPAAAAVLQRQGRFTQSHFFGLLRVWLAIISIVVALVGAWDSGSLFMAIPFGIMLYCFVAILAFPLAHLWLRLAK